MSFECGYDENDLVSSLQSELQFYKNKQETWREEIDEIVKSNGCHQNIDENEKLFADIEGNYSNYKQISTEAINNLKQQINFIGAEKLIYNNLWKISQQTIENLEYEINQYLKQSSSLDSIQSLRNQLKLTEQKSIQFRHELNERKEAEMSLEQSKHLCEVQMKALDKKYSDLIAEHKEVLEQLKNMERTLHDHRSEMNEMKKERDDYKKRFLSCCDQNKQFQVRESVAYAKIQDAVQMVEAAMREKDAAVQREKEIRDEFDRLTMTIGRVIEEAGEKVEGNIDELKTNYSKRIQKMEDLISKLMLTKETLTKENQMSKKHIQEIQSNVSQLIKSNETLNSDLQTASKTIVELEMKLKAYDKLIACEQATSKETEERSVQLRNLLDNNIKLKQRWKDTFSDITEKLQKEIVHLQAENTKLITQNQKLNKDLIRCKTNQR